MEEPEVEGCDQVTSEKSEDRPSKIVEMFSEVCLSTCNLVFMYVFTRDHMFMSCSQ